MRPGGAEGGELTLLRCGGCRFFVPEDLRHGSCTSPKFIQGYNHPKGFDGISTDSVRVENDEGWAFLVGRDFGCVHFEKIE